MQKKKGRYIIVVSFIFVAFVVPKVYFKEENSYGNSSSIIRSTDINYSVNMLDKESPEVSVNQLEINRMMEASWTSINIY